MPHAGRNESLFDDSEMGETWLGKGHRPWGFGREAEAECSTCWAGRWRDVDMLTSCARQPGG